MKQSAGILLYRMADGRPEFLLVHPGGPFFAKKDAGAWSIPKGEFTPGEDPQETAIREFHEETGREISGEFKELKPVKLKSGKKIFAWAVEGDLDVSKVQSNSFELEWPPNSGNFKIFPEIDKAEWFSAAEAKIKLNPAQAAFVDELLSLI